MKLDTILAAIKNAIPTIMSDAQTVIKIANEVKSAAQATGEWTDAHQSELNSLTSPVSGAQAAPVATK